MADLPPDQIAILADKTIVRADETMVGAYVRVLTESNHKRTGKVTMSEQSYALGLLWLLLASVRKWKEIPKRSGKMQLRWQTRKRPSEIHNRLRSGR